LRVFGSTQSLVHWPVGIPTIFNVFQRSNCRAIVCKPYLFHIIHDNDHLKFHCLVLVSMIVWIWYTLPFKGSHKPKKFGYHCGRAFFTLRCVIEDCLMILNKTCLLIGACATTIAWGGCMQVSQTIMIKSQKTYNSGKKSEDMLQNSSLAANVTCNTTNLFLVCSSSWRLVRQPLMVPSVVFSARL